MTSYRAVLWLPVVLMACRGGDTLGRGDSSAVHTIPTPSASPVALNPGWDDSVAGPVLILPAAESAPRVSVVLPLLTDSVLTGFSALDLDSLSGLPVDLFGPAGSVGSSVLATAPVKRAVEGCLAWPETSLAKTPDRPWRVGFRQGAAVGLKLDSIESMPSADSSRIAAEIARLVSPLAEGADSAFRGLPFSVRKAYRFSIDGTSVLVSDVVRKIAQEANPREEHILLIAERPQSGEEKYTVAFHSRVSGSEDVVRTHEILSAVRFVRNARPVIVVAFGYADGGRIALLERTGEKRWKVSWRSAYTGC